MFCTPVFNGFFKEFIFHRFFAEQALEFMGIGALKDLPAGGQPYGVLKKVGG